MIGLTRVLGGILLFALLHRSMRQFKAERKMMKLKIQFGREIRFDQPIRCLPQSPAQWSPGIRVLLRARAMARRLKPFKPQLHRGILGDSSS
jgi:hypothetical protein